MYVLLDYVAPPYIPSGSPLPEGDMIVMDDSLPPDWQALKDPRDDDKMYYYNKVTSKTQWQRPTRESERELSKIIS